MTTPEKYIAACDHRSMLKRRCANGNTSVHAFCWDESALNYSIMPCEICNQNGENNSTADKHSVKCSWWFPECRNRLVTVFCRWKPVFLLHSSTTLVFLLATGRSVRSCSFRQHCFGKLIIINQQTFFMIMKVRTYLLPNNPWEDLVWLNEQSFWEKLSIKKQLMKLSRHCISSLRKMLFCG